MSYQPNPDPSTAANQLVQIANTEETVDILNDINVSVTNLTGARGIAGDLRVTILSGSVALSSGTVTTLSNQAQMGGYFSNYQVPAVQNSVAQSNINNVSVS